MHFGKHKWSILKQFSILYFPIFHFFQMWVLNISSFSDRSSSRYLFLIVIVQFSFYILIYFHKLKNNYSSVSQLWNLTGYCLCQKAIIPTSTQQWTGTPLFLCDQYINQSKFSKISFCTQNALKVQINYLNYDLCNSWAQTILPFN